MNLFYPLINKYFSRKTCPDFSEGVQYNRTRMTRIERIGAVQIKSAFISRICVIRVLSFFLFSFFFFLGIWDLGFGTWNFASAQTAGIFGSTNLSLNTTGTHAHSSAIFDISSTAKGLLIPRMTTAQRDAIATPATSLFIFNTTTNQYEYYNGAAWVGIATTAAAGWSLTGNSGTTDGTNFIGTTDDVPFNIKVNNQKAGRIENSAGSNTFFGYQAGNSNSGNNYNTAFGREALFSNNSGYYNTVVGYQSLYFNTTGFQNTAYGYKALKSNTTGASNTAVGLDALFNNTTGNDNTAIGFDALESNTTAAQNVAIGKSALSSSTGTGNIAIGYSAGYSGNANTTGNYNIFLGYGTGLGSATQRTNATAIGYNAKVDADNAMVLGGTGADAVNVGIGTTAPTAKLHIKVSNDNNQFRVETRQSAYSIYIGGGASIHNAYISAGAELDGGSSANTTAPAWKLDLLGFSDYFAIERGMNNGVGQPVSWSEFLRINNSGNVGIGTTAPTSMLSVGASNQFQVNSTGNIVKLNNVTTSFPAANASGVLTNDGTGTLTWAAAPAAGWSLTGNSGTTDGTNFIGTTDNIPFNIRVNNQKAGRIDPTLQNTFFGYQVGNSNTGSSNTAIGNQAFFSNTTGTGNTSAGFQALESNTTGTDNTAMGRGALLLNISGGSNSAFGTQSLANNTGNGNTANGYFSLSNNNSGTYNTANGDQALNSNTAGANNTASGSYALYSNVAGSNGTAIGYNAMGNANNTTTAFTNYNVAVGFEALRGSTTASANTGNYNTALGYQTLWSNTSAGNNTAIGRQALYSNTTSGQNTAIGAQSLYNNIGQGNTAIGYFTLFQNTSGAENIAIGPQALQQNSTGSRNTATGSSALTNTTGSDNTGNGAYALNNTNTGNRNTALGESALFFNTTGNNNTALGYGADVTVNNLTNATAIGYNAKVGASNSLVLGGTGADAVNVGIGTTTPTKTFSVAEKFQVDVNGNIVKLNNVATSFPAANASGVLTNDGTGTLTWAAAPAAGWSLLGNSGTTDGTNFIGNTDDKPFNIRANNQRAGRIETDAFLGNNNANTFLGYLAGNANTTGSDNTGSGIYALRSNTTGSSNIASGESVLYNNTKGGYNTAIGGYALYQNVAGSKATAIGYNAMSNTNNTATAFTNYNVAVGYEALRGSGTPANNTGNYNTALGYQTLLSNTTGGNNTANGKSALYSNTTGSQNTASGVQVLFSNTTGNSNTASGYLAGFNNITGSNNTFIGYQADLVSATHTNATALGYNAKVDADNAMVLGGTGADAVNVGIGTTTPTKTFSVAEKFQVDVNGNILKINNVATSFPAAQGAASTVLQNDGAGNLSWSAVSGTLSGGTTNYIPKWTSATSLSSTSNIYDDGTNVGVGELAPSAKLQIKGSADNSVLIVKANATQSNTNPLIKLQKSSGGDLMWIHSDIFYNVFMGVNAGSSNNSGGGATNNTFIGYNSGFFNTTGNTNTAVGGNALRSNTTGNFNSAFGEEALYSNTTAGENAAVGNLALYNQSFSNGGVAWSSYNTALGNRALYSNQPTATNNGANNTALGWSALYSNTTGYNNTAVGYQSLYTNISGIYNTSVGLQSLQFSTGSRNTALGYGAGGNVTTGGNNTFIGELADLSVAASQHSNATAIGYNAKVDADNALILGGTGADAVNVGIGTTAPKAKLQVVGDAALGDGTAANEGVVTVFLTNNTGAASVKGEIVIVDPAVNNAYVKTTTAGHTSVIGVVYETGIANGQPCRIAISGIVFVTADAATVRGQHCITGSATAGAAGSVATPGAGTSIGVWLENVGIGAQGKVLLR